MTLALNFDGQNIIGSLLPAQRHKSVHTTWYFHIMIFLAFAVDGSEWKTKFG